MSAESAGPQPPARGTRPRNRRALILRAATDLFYRHGYDHVGVGDIAEAVAIGPSALYRHFPGKQHLFHAVLTEAVQPMRAQLDGVDLADRVDGLRAFAQLTLDHRELAVLWQRETRHMTSEIRAQARHELREMGTRLANKVRLARPEVTAAAAELLAWALVATGTSPSFHCVELPRADYEPLLAELLGLVLDVELPDTFAEGLQPPRPGVLEPYSRREALLAQAIRMFAEDGYTGVGIPDIGRAAGIKGTGVYNYFDNKIELLVVAIERGTAMMHLDLSHAYEIAPDAASALRRLLSSYLTMCHRHHNLVGLLITETEHLPEVDRDRARRAQRGYIDEWVHLLCLAQPDFDPITARIRVHATLAVANNIARTPYLRRNPDAFAVVERICTRLLGLPCESTP